MLHKPYRPPFELTARALSMTAEIMRLVGKHEGLLAPAAQPKLRKQNQIRTVTGSLAIEGNTLDLDQVTALLEGKRVTGTRREILEVQNAIETYARASSYAPSSEKAFLAAHQRIMRGLVDDAGRYRSKGVGIFHGKKLAHMAPPARQVPRLVAQLFRFAASDPTHLLTKSAVVHYEIEFIHPFSDGNGRMGRLWQHVLLLRAFPLFEAVPFESVIHQRQAEYYRVLGECDRAGDATRFVEFSLQAVHDALAEFLDQLRPEPATSSTRLDLARNAFGDRPFSRRDYLGQFKLLSTATASRDLRHGVDRGLLERQGTKALARYRFR